MNDHSGVYVLCGGIVFFTCVVFLAAWLFPQNEKLTTYFAGVLTGFSSSLFLWMQKK